MGEEEGAVVRQIAKERKRKTTEKGETNTEHKYNYIQVHMLVPKTKLHHLSGKGRLTGEQVDAIKRDLQVSLEHLDVLKCYFYSSIWRHSVKKGAEEIFGRRR